MSERRRVVITGMGLVSPLGHQVDQFWERLIASESGIRPIELFDTTEFDVKFGGECTDFTPEPVVDKRSAKRLDRFAQMAIVAAHSAWMQCGLADGGLVDPTRFGVITGTGIGGISELEEQHKRLIEKGPSKVSAFTIPKLMSNAASGNISIMLGACGPSTAVGTACASATNAMGDAMHAIRRGDVDVVISGGSEAALTPLGMSAFASMKALSTRNDDPKRASRPFDKDRDGFVMGEGAGMVVLEEYEHAKKRGANILCELLGFGTSADAYHITQPQEAGIGASAAMRFAVQDARINLDDVDYINAHGTSTPLGDIAETLAIKKVFGAHAKKVAISSTKSAVGHLLGASGGVELVASIQALRNGVIPPTINLENQDDACDLNYTPLTAQDARVDIALSNSFGFGGHNACVIIGRIK
ncbi:MAG: beta-ketoacyl-ACP synthase II [Phycisphaerales bacterium]|nr:beta-ketoacyl-ACP synthase II [Phycisphaerales bacterium]MCB9856815.1 beta-ketoacyl-ACP synthase II [Phycisphaerales bacterium]MCB9862058.1 beta-ketoacyl-ACP synthase II [Phycisphaerales bacterium]